MVGDATCRVVGNVRHELLAAEVQLEDAAGVDTRLLQEVVQLTEYAENVVRLVTYRAVQRFASCAIRHQREWRQGAVGLQMGYVGVDELSHDEQEG